MLFLLKLTAAACVAVTALVSPPAFAQDGDPIVANVDGIEVRLSEVESAHATMPEQYRAVPLDQIFEPLLENLVGTKLLVREARRQKLDQEADVQRTLRRVEEQVLEGAALRAHLDEAITEEKIRARYDAMIADEVGRVELHARHILVATEDEAKAIIVDLNEGADFAATARDKSTGPSGPNGGDLGFFSRETMVKPFADAAFDMADGEYSSAPVQTQFGWHVIKVEERRTAPPPAFEETAPEIQQEMVREEQRALLEGLKEGVTIERFNMDGTPRSDG